MNPARNVTSPVRNTKNCDPGTRQRRPGGAAGTKRTVMLTMYVIVM